MVVLRAVAANVIEQDVQVVETRVRDVRIEDGDEVVVQVVGKARVYAGAREIEVVEARLVKVVEVVKAKR